MTLPCSKVFLLYALLAGSTTSLGDEESSSSSGNDEAPRPQPPRGLAKRIPWTTSKVRGRPEPPLPYRAERVFPRFHFEKPLLITRAPGTERLFVGTETGKIYSFPPDPEYETPDVFLDVAQDIPGATGIYGLAFHPRFEENRYAYVCYICDSEAVPKEEGTRVSRFEVTRTEPPRCELESEQRLLTWLVGGHNGGCLKFGPLDGYLYIATGDAAVPFPPDPYDTGQDNSDLLSSILRIDVSRSDGRTGYAIPSDNPFVGVEGSRPEIWAYGFRNPWKMGFDAATGDLWVGDVGWELWEMLYLVEKGGNYGWSIMEGPEPVRPDVQQGPTPISPPVVSYSHSEGRSITGGLIYRGKRLQDLVGAYIYGDYETGRIWALRHDGESVTWHQELADTVLKVVAFGEDHAGNLYFVEHMGNPDPFQNQADPTGRIYRLVPNPPAAVFDFPRQLSETGLFTSTEDLQPAPGVLPYAPIAEPWADHATAQRYVALPGDSQIQVRKINLFDWGAWKFPADTVFTKTLSLDMEFGNPSSRRRLETQLLHYDGDAWRGYSYAWNDAQTDATLVLAKGQNQTYTIRDGQAPTGRRQQTWRFASRSECLLCHTTFSYHVLGFTPLQLDMDYTYGEVTDNQLRVLRRREVIEGDYEVLLAGRPRLVNPHDSRLPLHARARAYLHANCAHCHRRHSGGNAALVLSLDLEMPQTLTVDVQPNLGNFGIPEGRIISKGKPYSSILHYRMASVGTARMPRLGTRVVDEAGLELIHDWIQGLPVHRPGTLPPAGPPRDESLDAGALAVLSAAEEATPSARAEAVDNLLSSTSGALALLHLVDAGTLQTAAKEEAIARALAHPSRVVQDLFLRFVPEEKRAKRLGNVVEPAGVLALSGNTDRGRDLFEGSIATQCKNCHSVAGADDTLGPPLAESAKKYTRAELLESILEPSKRIDPKYVAYVVVTQTGDSYTGVLLHRDGQHVVLKDSAKRRIVVPAADIRVLAPQKTSLMPDLLLSRMTAQEAADLLDFVVSCRDAGEGR
jgi:uncharacterized repeat protein (TIGR03806 family)